MGCMCETAMVSIIVPIYNVEAYLKECIDSIRGQTMQEMDIILVDDGSPDSCPQICDQFAAEDKRIRVFHRENMGVSAARNFGMEQAEADWIMFVDPDDWLEKDAVEVLVAFPEQTTLCIRQLKIRRENREIELFRIMDEFFFPFSHLLAAPTYNSSFVYG